MRPYAVVSAVLAPVVIALAVVSGGEVRASIMPDSQAAICPAAIDRISAVGGDLSDSETVSRMLRTLLLRVGSRPDRRSFRVYPPVDFFTAAIFYAAAECPNFAPYNGPLPGHLRVSASVFQGVFQGR